MLYRNTGRGFENVSKQSGPIFSKLIAGRGLAIGDFDNDGSVDALVSVNNGAPVLLRNNAGRRNHWLGLQLVTKDRRPAAGTKLILEVNGHKLTRFAKGGSSYLSANDTRHLFGLGTATKPGKLRIEWSSGTPRTEEWSDLAIDSYQRIVQGSGKNVGALN